MTLLTRRSLGMSLISLSILPALPRLSRAGEDDEALLTVSAPGLATPMPWTRTALEALAQTSFTTKTMWTEGQKTFSGPLMRDVLSLAGAGGQPVRAVADNDYAVQIPHEVITDVAPIIATRIDGEPFSRRNLGPLWVVWPYDMSPDFRTETIFSMSIWQLVRLEAGQG